MSVPNSGHHGLCLTRSNDGPCNCAAIADCMARTHHPFCLLRYSADDSHACNCANLAGVAS